MSMKNSNGRIGNRTCDLPACSAVPQPTAIPRTYNNNDNNNNNNNNKAMIVALACVWSDGTCKVLLFWDYESVLRLPE
jgi:hypothetical protein